MVFLIFSMVIVPEYILQNDFIVKVLFFLFQDVNYAFSEGFRVAKIS